MVGSGSRNARRKPRLNRASDTTDCSSSSDWAASSSLLDSKANLSSTSGNSPELDSTNQRTRRFTRWLESIDETPTDVLPRDHEYEADDEASPERS